MAGDDSALAPRVPSARNCGRALRVRVPSRALRVLDLHDVIVLGAGVVGLSIARSLASGGRRVLVLEREAAVGRGGSSRSSGVVHAGLHHEESWLKSRLARRGRQMLYVFCARHGVPFQKTGKWIVATEASELGALQILHDKARALHLEARLLSPDEISRDEPRVKALGALEIRETGVVRPAELCRALLLEVEALGGEVLIGVTAERIRAGEPEVEVQLKEGPCLRAREVIVATGLESDALLAQSGLDVEAHGLKQHACKGEWVALSERHRKSISRHIYPLPHEDGSGLGVHLTRDVDGYLYAGPDVTWQSAPDHSLTPEKVPLFGAALRRFYPEVADAELHPMMAGIRPKLSREGAPARDFLIWQGREHGWPGVTALLGIESPGLTACLALGDHVAQLLT